jgi:hypothetical protein
MRSKSGNSERNQFAEVVGTLAVAFLARSTGRVNYWRRGSTAAQVRRNSVRTAGATESKGQDSKDRELMTENGGQGTERDMETEQRVFAHLRLVFAENN